MDFILLIVVIAVIALPLMFLHRRYQNKKAEAEMRESALLQENVVQGAKTMRGQDYVPQPKPKANLHVVDKQKAASTETTPTPSVTPSPAPTEDWMFGAASLAGTIQTSDTSDKEPEKFSGGGGTFDGGGSSGDWDRTSSSNDSSSSSYDSGSSSSDSGSSSSSSNND